MALQMLPMLQGEKLVIPGLVEGFMMYLPPAGQVSAERGQHCCAATVLPSAQVVESQSWTAPKVWPTSWAMTSHSVSVLTTTLAPDTVSFEPDWVEACAVLTQAWPSHARPTAEPVLQVVRRAGYVRSYLSIRKG